MLLVVLESSMLFLNFKKSVVFFSTCLAFISSYAGRPMVVDDASLVPAHSCQLDSWMQNNPKDKEYWAIPSCNIGGNFEFGVGMGRHFSDEAGNATYTTVQGKTLIKPLETNNWGIGVSFATQINNNHTSEKDWTVNVPLSISMLDDHFLVHTNVGWLREHTTHREQTTWGVGTETFITKPLTLTAEIYGNDRNDSFYQTGIKYMLYKENVQFNASYGNRLNQTKDDSFFSVGLVFVTIPFF